MEVLNNPERVQQFSEKLCSLIAETVGAATFHTMHALQPDTHEMFFVLEEVPFNRQLDVWFGQDALDDE